MGKILDILIVLIALGVLTHVLLSLSVHYRRIYKEGKKTKTHAK